MSMRYKDGLEVSVSENKEWRGICYILVPPPGNNVKQKHKGGNRRETPNQGN